MPDGQKVQAATEPQAAGNGYNPFAYYWSSTAVSFAALMELLKVAQEAYNDMAECSMKTTAAQGAAVIASADSTYNMYHNDATSTFFQMGEQIASASTTGVGVFATMRAGSTSNVNGETTKLNNITDIQNQAKGLGGGDLLQRPLPDQNPELDHVRGSIRDGTFDYAKQVAGQGQVDSPVFNARGEQVLGNNNAPVTLKQVLESEFSDGNKSQIMKKLATERGNQTRVLSSASNSLSQTTTLINSITQGFNAAGNASMKAGEAKAAEDKGLAAADQTRAQAGQEFMREANKSQQDQFGQYTQQAGQVFRTISEIVQVDTRG